MTMQMRQQRETFRNEGEASSMNIPESQKWPNSADVGSGCARAQITYSRRNSDNQITETRQNADNQNNKSE